MFAKRTNRGGFTLVELLVVIGIIALLISILLPSLNRAREQAKAVQCMSNMRQLFVYTNLYMNDFNGWALPANGVYRNYEAGDWYGIIARQYFKVNMGSTSTSNGGFLAGKPALDALAPTGMPKLLTCPSTNMPNYNSAIGFHSTGQTETPLKWSYIYQRGLGDKDKLQGTAAPSANDLIIYSPKKRSHVPPSTLILADTAPFLPNNRGR